ncbi:hypothetical protein [Dictyobacter kobayashii]|uniref:hypothetical protein n=1 Tax=Dictyobacter kobayashii TaxID=2014872 RepID=UPI000F81C6FC|nr:hypothetical protein [Dictyobacter kobayashii]
MAKFYYGGQAVMEGVMMRGRNSVAVAVRRLEGDIYVHEEALEPRIYQNKYLRLPFLRGMVLLWEMLVLGTAYDDALCQYRFGRGRSDCSYRWRRSSRCGADCREGTAG